MLLDIQEIERLGKEREKQNLKFLNFLKGQNEAKIDRLVHELYDLYLKEIDCTTCGNCCTKLRPILTELDIDVLIKTLEISREKFRKKYIMFDDEGDMLFNHLPCKFLKNRKCTIYVSRPHDCQSYPHLQKSEIIHRLYGIFENYSICPIVFNIIEELKIRLNYK